ncbi:Poly [Hordeum vulgare]|nr:Poly [Hordeum vulgare]
MAKRKEREKGRGNDVVTVKSRRKMTCPEMQALARARGLNANGGKKDVLQRLLSIPATSVVDCGIQDKKEVAEDDDGKVEELKKENIITDVMLDAA